MHWSFIYQGFNIRINVLWLSIILCAILRVLMWTIHIGYTFIISVIIPMWFAKILILPFDFKTLVEFLCRYCDVFVSARLSLYNLIIISYVYILLLIIYYIWYEGNKTNNIITN